MGEIWGRRNETETVLEIFIYFCVKYQSFSSKKKRNKCMLKKMLIEQIEPTLFSYV